MQRNDAQPKEHAKAVGSAPAPQSKGAWIAPVRFVIIWRTMVYSPQCNMFCFHIVFTILKNVTTHEGLLGR